MVQYESICNFGGEIVKPISLKTFIDDYIPINIYIIYPYGFCVFYVVFSGFLFSFYKKISAVKIATFYFSAILVYLFCYSIYLIFPTTASEVMITKFDSKIMNEGMFKALQLLYHASTPLGDFPSLHVAPMVYMGLFLYNNWRSLFWIFLPFGFLGSIGTVLLKFHVFIGFLGGAVVGIIGYYIFYKTLLSKYTSDL